LVSTQVRGPPCAVLRDGAGAAKALVLVHDESGSCAYLARLLVTPATTLSGVRVVALQAPEISDGRARPADEAARAASYAAAARAALRGRPPAVVVGGGACAKLAARVAAALDAESLVLVDAARGGAGTDPGRSDAVDRGRLVGRGSAGEFAAAFYGGYAAAKFGAGALDDAAAPGATVADARRRLPAAPGAREDLDALREFAFHYAPEPLGDGPARGVEVRTPSASRGSRWAARFGAAAAGCDELLAAAPLAALFGDLSSRTFAYVPFVNRVDADGEDCLRCWRQPEAGAPSVFFVHGGIGVIGVAANWLRKLEKGAGLYSVQAPELKDGDYQGRTRERNSQLQRLISRPFPTRFG